MSETHMLRMKFETNPATTWADKLRDMIDAAELTVEHAGWPVRAVCIVISPNIVGLPDFVLGTSATTETKPVRMAPKKKAKARKAKR